MAYYERICDQVYADVPSYSSTSSNKRSYNKISNFVEDAKKEDSKDPNEVRFDSTTDCPNQTVYHDFDEHHPHVHQEYYQPNETRTTRTTTMTDGNQNTHQEYYEQPTESTTTTTTTTTTDGNQNNYQDCYEQTTKTTTTMTTDGNQKSHQEYYEQPTETTTTMADDLNPVAVVDSASADSLPPPTENRNIDLLHRTLPNDDQVGEKQRLEAAIHEHREDIARVEEARRVLKKAEADLEKSKKRLDDVSREVKDVLVKEPRCDWNERYRELVQYKKEHGHCRVQRNYMNQVYRENSDVRRLGGWVGFQRREYRKDNNSIRPDRVMLLNELGFDWELHETLWDTRFNELQKYIADHGDLNVPPKEPYVVLYRWIKNQRAHYKRTPKAVKDSVENNNNKKEHDTIEDSSGEDKDDDEKDDSDHEVADPERPSSRGERLTPERLRRLNSIGFHWDRYHKEFETGFDTLRAFKKVFGHVHVSGKDDKSIVPVLAEWVTKMRKQYRNYVSDKKGKKAGVHCLTADRVKRLETLGFRWDEKEIKWDRQYQRLRVYRLAHNGKFDDMEKHDTNLFKWVSGQRTIVKRLKQNGKPFVDHGGRVELLEQSGITATWGLG